jgi:hypothetical protein
MKAAGWSTLEGFAMLSLGSARRRRDPRCRYCRRADDRGLATDRPTREASPRAAARTGHWHPHADRFLSGRRAAPQLLDLELEMADEC